MASNIVKNETHQAKEICAFILDLIPDIDPEYANNYAIKIYEKYEDNIDIIQEKVMKLFQRKEYPTKRDYERKCEKTNQVELFTTKFNLDTFLQAIPNPIEYFQDKRRIVFNEQSKHYWDDIEYGLTFLQNLFKQHYIKTLHTAYHANRFNLTETVAAIKVSTTPTKIKIRKKDFEYVYQTKNIELLKEIAYLTHWDEIHNYLQQRENELKEKIRIAKENGTLFTCECCYEDEILLENCVKCENDHLFCTTCVKRACEILYAQGKVDFPCLNCTSIFTLHDLKKVLSPLVFSNVAKKKQLDEIKAAGISELESCPFCEFCLIPVPTDKIFSCLNDKCMLKTCRGCRELSHIPFTCKENKKLQAKQKKIQNYYENAMTESLVRTCWKCGMKFIKKGGCNKMSCPCGAKMCYICKQPVKDYSHFNGPGGDKHHLCPLFNDTKKLHENELKETENRIKHELQGSDYCKKGRSRNSI